MESSTVDLVRAALARRAALFERPDLDVCRLFHGFGEGEPRLRVDRYAEVAVVTHKDDLSEDAIAAVADEICAALPIAAVVARRQRGRNLDARATEVRVVRGVPPDEAVVVREGPLRFRVDPMAAGLRGLFMDARPAREWLLENAADRRVLNLFAHGGSLGVAAAVGGARSVSHVDSDGAALELARANHALNDVPADDRAFVRSDVYRSLSRLGRSRQRFDGVILDPPPVVRPRGSSDRPRPQDLGRLAGLAAAILAPGGWLLCFFNRPHRPRAEFETEVIEGAGVPLSVCWRGTSGDDYPEVSPEAKLRFTAFVRTEPPPAAR